jgi:D-3-phosphoglycerate dehydrogenase
MFNLLIAARSFGFASGKALDEFKKFNNMSIEQPPHDLAFSEQEMFNLVPGMDAIIVGTDKITKNVIQKADRLRFITKHGVGVDNIDIPAATEAGIIVMNMPGINDRAVADMTFGMILSLSREICRASSQIKSGNWGKVLGNDVFGKVLGIIGTGNIGMEVIKRASGFDMKVLAYDVFPNQKYAADFDFRYVEFEELLKSSDVISIHVPLNSETRDLIAEPELLKMKKSALLINTSRSGIVNENDLLKALASETLAGAAIDVYPKNFPQYPGVYDFDNLIITPHIAAYTYETLETMDLMIVEAYKEILSGKLPSNLNILNT